MAKIESLSMLNSSEGKVLLNEVYGPLFEVNNSKLIVNEIKNTDPVGSLGGASVRFRRFVNTLSKNYGTARAAHDADAVKVDDVILSFDQHKEAIQGVEEFDNAFCGIEDFLTKIAKQELKAMNIELETAFFTEAVTKGTKATPSASAVEDVLEELIVAVETVKNKYVDGVDRDEIVLVLNPTVHSQVRKYIDKVKDGSVDDKTFNVFHGVKVYSTNHLPAKTKAIAMAKGSVAQMCRPELAPAKQLELSKKYAIGYFYDYGTACLAPDLIFTWKED